MNAEGMPALLDEVRELPVWVPTPRELADLELLLSGGFAPLTGFLSARDVAAVTRTGRLADGTPWPAPITLTVGDERTARTDRVVLADAEGTPLAVVDVAERVQEGQSWRVAGPVRALRPVAHGPFRALRRSPEEVSAALPGGRVLAAVVREPLHRRRLAQLNHHAQELEANVLVLVCLPETAPEGLVRAVLAAAGELPAGSRIVAVSLVLRGDVEQQVDRLLGAHVAASYGATHLLSERPLSGAPLSVVVPGLWAYDPQVGAWKAASQVTDGRDEPSAEQLSAWLDAGEPIPEWVTPPRVAKELAAARPPRHRRGLTLFFTGLSGSGKSTVARGVAEALAERGRTVSLLDGDVVRRLLSAGLTFSRGDRDLNIRRIGYVAAEITRHGGVAICAPIAPYAATRAEVARMVREVGDFLLVHVATPLEVCEARDAKGLYAKARAGLIGEFTGVSDPYEVPDDADLVLDTSQLTVDEAVAKVLELLRSGGWVRDAGH